MLTALVLTLCVGFTGMQCGMAYPATECGVTQAMIDADHYLHHVDEGLVIMFMGHGEVITITGYCGETYREQLLTHPELYAPKIERPLPPGLRRRDVVGTLLRVSGGVYFRGE